MEYLVGAALALGVGVFTTLAGLDRDRALYPIVLIVIASYYDLFAVMGGGDALGVETAVFIAFVTVSVIGFKTNLWFVAAALLGHGLFDFAHPHLVTNAGVPAWWPMFCLSFDAAAAGYLAWLLLSARLQVQAARNAGERQQRGGSSPSRSCVGACIACPTPTRSTPSGLPLSAISRRAILALAN